MKKIIITGFLIALYAGLVVIVIAPLLAEIHFSSAKKFILQDKLAAAESEFKNAIIIDPYNSRYLAGLGELLLRQSDYHDDKKLILERAERLFKQALNLNPMAAEYSVKSGQIYLAMFMQCKDRSEYLEKTFNNFKEALRNDPNGFNISYQIGYAGIAVWESLSKEQTAFIIERLRYSIERSRWHSKYIYSKIWQKTKNFDLLKQITSADLYSNESLYDFIVRNNLWQFHKEQEAVVNFYLKKEKPEKFKNEMKKNLKTIEYIKKEYAKDGGPYQITERISPEKWHGKSCDGKNVINNGFMYWDGTIYTLLYMKQGTAVISINAKKFMVIKTINTHNPKFYPYMIVKLDGKAVGETFVSNDDWKSYEFTVETNGGPKVLSISFVNDIYIPDRAEDRNLQIGSVDIIYS